MALRICSADGNFTAAIWSPVTTNHQQITRSSNSPTTTSYVYSPTAIVSGGETVDGILLLVEKLLAGGTFSVSLHDGVSDAREVTIDVSDLPLRRTLILFKLPTPLPGTGALWKVGVRSSVAGTVRVYRSGTADWSRLLRTTATSVAPAATDSFFIAGEMTGAGALTTRTVTFDGNAPTTTYGSGTGTGFYVGKGATFAFRTTDATYLKVSGDIYVGDAGLLTIGTVAAPIPRGSVTATVEFACTSDGLYGFRNFGRIEMQGLSRTVGKNVTSSKHSANVSVGATVIPTEADTGWLAGDEIRVAGVSPTGGHAKRFLATNATSASLTLVASVPSHIFGTAPDFVHRMILLTRNILIRGASASLRGYSTVDGGVYDLAWVRFKWMGTTSTSTPAVGYASSSNYGAAADAASIIARFCAFEDYGTYGVVADRLFTVEDCVFSAGGEGANALFVSSSATGTTQRCVGITTSVNLSGGSGVSMDDWYIWAGIIDIGTTGVWAGNCTNLEVCCTYNPTGMEVSLSGGNHANWRVWGCGLSFSSAGGIRFNGCTNTRITNIKAYGNYAFNLAFTGTNRNLLLDDVELDGLNASVLSSGATATVDGIEIQGTSPADVVRIRNLRCGTGAAPKQPHTGTDIRFDSVPTNSAGWDITLDNPRFSAPSPFDPAAWLTQVNTVPPAMQAGGLGYLGGALRLTYLNGALDHRTYLVQRGSITSDGAVFRTGAPSERLTMSHATNTLRSNVRRKAVTQARTVTLSVWLYKDASYTGADPKLILLANPPLGIANDLVLASFDAPHQEWGQLTVTTPVAPLTGVFEFAVEAVGVNGVLWIDDWDRP